MVSCETESRRKFFFRVGPMHVVASVALEDYSVDNHLGVHRIGVGYVYIGIPPGGVA